MVIYVKGDLIKAFQDEEIDILCHQTNCVTTNVHGFAKFLKDSYPKVQPTTVMSNKFGDMLSFVEERRVRNGLIFNLYTQFYTGSPSNRECRSFLGDTVDSFEVRISYLKALLKVIKENYVHGNKIGIPLIASGLAKCKIRGKDMSDLKYFKTFIAPHIESIFTDKDIYVYYL